MTNARRTMLLKIVALAVLLAATAILVADVEEFFYIDTYLDLGGGWNRKLGVCEGVQPREP
jgi:hypothetical protein